MDIVTLNGIAAGAFGVTAALATDEGEVPYKLVALTVNV